MNHIMLIVIIVSRLNGIDGTGSDMVNMTTKDSVIRQLAVISLCTLHFANDAC